MKIANNFNRNRRFDPSKIPKICFPVVQCKLGTDFSFYLFNKFWHFASDEGLVIFNTFSTVKYIATYSLYHITCYHSLTNKCNKRKKNIYLLERDFIWCYFSLTSISKVIYFFQTSFNIYMINSAVLSQKILQLIQWILYTGTINVICWSNPAFVSSTENTSKQNSHTIHRPIIQDYEQSAVLWKKKSR